MKKIKLKNSVQSFEKELQKSQEIYVLKLYVAGVSPQSVRAITNITNICKKYIPDSYTLEIIDIFQQNQLLNEEQILAAPTLVKKYPLPEKRLIGDMSNEQRVLNGLGLTEK